MQGDGAAAEPRSPGTLGHTHRPVPPGTRLRGPHRGREGDSQVLVLDGKMPFMDPVRPPREAGSSNAALTVTSQLRSEQRVAAS